MEYTSKLTFACLAGCIIAPAASLAHGSMQTPISRVYQCFQEGPESPKSDACQAVVDAGGTQPLYDWMEVNQSDANGKHTKIIADGTLCAGGRDKYVGLDLPRRDWKKTTIVPNAKGKYKFKLYATTPHATKYLRFYITRDGWDRDKSLAWSDVERFAQKKSPTFKGNLLSVKKKLPEGKSGRHVILAIWQRSDSAEAFYSCSEVKVVAPSADLELASLASDGAAETSSGDVGWSEAGQLIAHNSLKPGSTVTFREFDAKGRDVAAHAITMDRRTADAASWPSALAEEVNEKSAIFRIGDLDESGYGLAITPVDGAVGNTVYASDSYPGYSYHIDIDVPDSQ